MIPLRWIFVGLATCPLVSHSMCAVSTTWYQQHNGQQTLLSYDQCVYGLAFGDTCQFTIQTGDSLRSSWHYGVGGGCAPWTFTLWFENTEIGTIEDYGSWWLTEPGLYHCHVAGLGGVMAYWRLHVIDGTGIPDSGAGLPVDGFSGLYVSETGTTVSGELTIGADGVFEIEIIDMAGQLLEREALRASKGSTPFSLAVNRLAAGCYLFRARDKERSFSRLMIVR